MLDDQNALAQHDPRGALQMAAEQWRQAMDVPLAENGPAEETEITGIIVVGTGELALAAMLVKTWLGKALNVPLEIVRGHDLPGYVSERTLVILTDDDTEEAASCLAQARERAAQVAILPAMSARMATVLKVRALTAVLVGYKLVAASRLKEIAETSDWLKKETENWLSTTATDKNEAKQLALLAVGKTAVFYGGELTAPLAYKWKTSWNENAKNTAFWNEYPEASHSEFLGWTSHPVEKPFAIFDLISSLEHPQILKQFTRSDKLLSGKRPKATVIDLRGDTLLKQLLWGCILADFSSCYVAILNGVDPTERLKREWASSSSI